MSRYIVTDLTRFSREDIVCTAVIDTATGECLRPLPYLETASLRKLDIHPGAIIEGTISKNAQNASPHTEDSSYVTPLSYIGPCSSEEFKHILESNLSQSISSGFGYSFQNGSKVIPRTANISKSIITIKVSPYNFSIFEDQYQKIKCSFRDSSGSWYNYLAITDRGYHSYALKHRDDGQFDTLQAQIRAQDEIYLRIGLSRAYSVGERDGYWLQVNGIYTFPDFDPEIRSY